MTNITQPLEAYRDLPFYEDLREAVDLSDTLSSELPVERKSKLNLRIKIFACNILQKINELKQQPSPTAKIAALAQQGALQIEHITGWFFEASRGIDLAFMSVRSRMETHKARYEALNPEAYQPVLAHSKRSSFKDIVEKSSLSAAIGKAVQKVGHCAGPGAAFATDMALQSANQDALTLRDKIIGGVAEAVIGAGLEATVEGPAFLIPITAQLVDYPAKAVKRLAKKSLDRLPHEECKDVQPSIDDGYISIREATETTHALADLARKPKKLIDAVHHGLVETAEKILHLPKDAADTVLKTYPAAESSSALSCESGGCMTPHLNAFIIKSLISGNGMRPNSTGSMRTEAPWWNMGAKKRLDEALQALQKHPKVQALKESVEKQFSQPVVVKLVMPKTAPFGCQFRFDETDIGKFVNPIIEISNTLDGVSLKGCIIAELSNLSIADKYADLGRRAILHSISKESYVREKEAIELGAAKNACSIAEHLVRDGIMPPHIAIIFTDPQLENQLTDEQRQLRDSHNAVYAADWERLQE